MKQVLICAGLAAALLLDYTGFMRMTLLCAAVHESAHVLAYWLCTGKLPHLKPEAGGIELRDTLQLSRTQELYVLAAGPAANFIFAAALLIYLQMHAGFRLYFLASVSLCTGLYNLLPVEPLDGAGILRVLCPAGRLSAFYRIQRVFWIVFVTLTAAAAVFGRFPSGVRIISLIGPGILIMRKYREKQKDSGKI